MGLLALGVEFFIPGAGDIVAIGACDDVAGNAHVVDLADPCGVDSVCAEMLAHIRSFASFIAAVHEREAGRGTPGSLAIGSFENHAALGEAIEVWCFANGVSVATQRAGFEVIGNDQEDVFDLCFRARRRNE